MFLFSSSRRHTRSYGDWSSDVCSSDLPAYTAPVDLSWADAQVKAKTVIRLGYYEDESFAANGWHLPLAHYLESWGDARTARSEERRVGKECSGRAWVDQ